MEMGWSLFPALWLSICVGMDCTLGQVVEGGDHGLIQGPEHNLYRHILDNYKPDSRPVKNASDAVVVTFALALNQLLDLDEKNQVLSTSIWIYEEWMDELLVWSAEDFHNQIKLMIPASSIWLPDIFIFNAAGDTTNGFIHVNGSKVAIMNNGQVAWMVPLMVNSACAVDVTYFPYDRQTCVIKFGSWIYDIRQLDIVLDASTPDLDHYVMNSEYDLENVSLTRGILDSSCCAGEGQHSMIELQVKLKRKSLFYDYIVIAPTIMLCVLTLASFLLPCDKGEKIAIGLTVFLTLYVLQLRIADNVPDTNSTPILGVFMLVVMTFNCVSLIMATVVMNIKKRGDTSQCPKVPYWLFVICDKGIGPIVCTLWKTAIPIPLSFLEEAVEHETAFDGPETMLNDPKRLSLTKTEVVMTWNKQKDREDSYSKVRHFYGDRNPQGILKRYGHSNNEGQDRTSEMSTTYDNAITITDVEGGIKNESRSLKTDYQGREDKSNKTHHPSLKSSMGAHSQERRFQFPDQIHRFNHSFEIPDHYNNGISGDETLKLEYDVFSYFSSQENFKGLRKRKISEKEQSLESKDDERVGNRNLTLPLSREDLLALKRARSLNLRKRQWFYVAEVVDKFAFFVYLILLTISIFTVLFLIPVTFRSRNE